MRKVERIDPRNVDALRLRDALASALKGGPAVSLTPIPVEVVPENIALLIETGGSTGAGKVVALSAQAMVISSQLSNSALGVTPNDRWSLTLPLHHIAGINQLLRSIDNGSEPVYNGGEFISIVPTQLYRAIRMRDAFFTELQRAKKVLIGGAATPTQLLETGKALGIPLVTSYGMTEMCGGVVYDGVPLPKVEVRINADNRIALKGPMRAEGYFNDEAGTQSAFVDGWFISSDHGEINQMQKLEVHGRADDIIISGGEKLSPRAVADLIQSHFPKTEVYVIGIPDHEWGQSLRLVMVSSDEIANVALTQIRDIVGRELGKVAAPRSLLLLPETPLKSNGKVDMQFMATTEPTQAL